MRAVVRQLALFFLVAMCPGLALALSETYEGKLYPRASDTPISITVQMEELGGSITGKIRTSHPLNGSIDSGRNVGGYCNLASRLSGSVTLRLYGNCDSTPFEGKYTIYYTQSKNLARGTFPPDEEVSTRARGAGLRARIIAASKSSLRQGQYALPRGLPRGDTNVEYLCANHCRTKMQACKSKANRSRAISE
jgi:hypothetical protein